MLTASAGMLGLDGVTGSAATSSPAFPVVCASSLPSALPVAVTSEPSLTESAGMLINGLPSASSPMSAPVSSGSVNVQLPSSFLVAVIVCELPSSSVNLTSTVSSSPGKEISNEPGVEPSLISGACAELLAGLPDGVLGVVSPCVVVLFFDGVLFCTGLLAGLSLLGTSLPPEEPPAPANKAAPPNVANAHKPTGTAPNAPTTVAAPSCPI